MSPVLLTSIHPNRNRMDTRKWNRYHVPMNSNLLIMHKNMMLSLSCYLRISNHLFQSIQYLYSSNKALNNVMDSINMLLKKFLIWKLTPWYEFVTWKTRRAWLNMKIEIKQRGPQEPPRAYPCVSLLLLCCKNWCCLSF